MSTQGIGTFGRGSWSDRSAADSGLAEPDRCSVVKLAQDLLTHDFSYEPVQISDLEPRIRNSTHPNIDLQRDLLCYLIANPDKLNAAIAHYASPGSFAARHGLSALYRVLTRFPDFDYETPDTQGNTQLHHAAVGLHEPLLDHMINMQKAHSKPNRAGASPLDYLTRYADRADHEKRQRVMHRLIAAGVQALNPSD